MLKNIDPRLSPELLYTLYCMGHGDEIVLSDAHFPAHSVNENVIRADGNQVEQLLKAIMPLFELDSYVTDAVVMMSASAGDELPPGLIDDYKSVLPENQEITFIDRFAFYERAQKASCVVITSSTRKYGNILLKKGVTPVEC
ncbi:MULTISPECIES: L-fucose mutarotase [Enterobacteriaceae]|jgi:L-fucose mutarotase|uniref:L-fucose mutarotase n=1 Tax=Atlantibacter subterraneus TaxID=255519 RepID=A0A3R9GQV2_9ENTR|nr:MULTISPECIES: L-fucose mutarotase [Enterobacteriaceae]MDZ5667769.1 L-fucose mutarotase [Atlantibacter hermannii]QFH72410.1 L-fucose mutarotase [Enterobacter sp. E76]MDA3134253.1 L-fucose mutarotase [Atlantibacter subterranea]MDV7022947.1 L-fucose mutarotase [Atlantibacter subterranea]MDW2741744.1 L-fucose mutarotase [Atlantibacter subterranea]